eukprot:CAMPEP_0115394948 /NCGR_PEP_ID=MMETSP0271-20121206/12532_1 /TAXON_ID=71861 /ORGANISM="Scrippsiella trochoidea, Strain CCMP3099" /LENGTH=890 /DNA_ID=CAMNT_0002818641 /DNA_START=71 /DNA_END=2741 /DNA_ORIENTATION=+
MHGLRADDVEAEELQPLTSRLPSGCDDLEGAGERGNFAEPTDDDEPLLYRRSVKVALVVVAAASCLLALVFSPIAAAGRKRASAGAVESLAATNVTAQNWGQDCFAPCSGPGLCPDFCGPGNACCRFGSTEDPPECAGIAAWGTLSVHTCVVPVNPIYEVVAKGPKDVKNWAADCWKACHNQSGYCQSFCGMGNACCRWSSPFDPPECQGILEWGSKDRHTCVAPADPVYMVALKPPEGTNVSNWGLDCYTPCNQKTGYCPEFCGLGNACCKWNQGFQAPECSGILAWGSKDRHTCVVPAHPHFQVAVAPADVLNWGQDCSEMCGGAGYCQEQCGMGNACCKWGSASDPPECAGIQQWGAKDRYTCVAPVSPAFQVQGLRNGSSVLNWGADCKTACNKSGFCEEFCGAGNACCLFGDAAAAPECHGILRWGSKDRYTCVAPVDQTYFLSPSPYGQRVLNWGQDCWSPCGEGGGACPNFCGIGNACCRFGSTKDPPECHGVSQWGSKEKHTCVAPVAPYLYVNHFAENCWEPCDGAGYCEDWCGEGNACCKMGRSEDPHECKGVTYWPTHATHTCVKAAGQYPGVPVAPPPGACIPGQVHNAAGTCVNADQPALMTFYVYYATSDLWPVVQNANLGNLEGILWYLHENVVTSCPRTGGINRIIRYVVTMQNTEALFKATSHQFGDLVRFNSTQCAGDNKTCNGAFSKYGYTVGCQVQETEKTATAKYMDPVLYSFPGGVGEGGECSAPDGESACTWKTEYAGEVRIDELSGIADTFLWCAQGNLEYNLTSDKGEGTTFWNNRRDKHWNSRRVAYVKELFKMKYPNYPVDIGLPVCEAGFDLELGRRHCTRTACQRGGEFREGALERPPPLVGVVLQATDEARHTASPGNAV